MSIKEVNEKIVWIGKGLLNRIKFEIFYSYSPFEFFKLEEKKKQLLEIKTHKSIYKTK